MSKYNRKNTIVLFDVDGTLTKSRGKITPEMLDLIKELRKKVTIGFVGGSDLVKQKEQVGDNVLELFDYCFPQNGVNAFKDGKEISKSSFLKKMGEDNVQRLINFTLEYLSKVKIPKKRGKFIEWRECMINISPIGRICTQEERDEFFKFDAEHKIREKMCEVLREKFKDLDLVFSIGGEISIDVFPKGWDKTYCLQFLDDYENVLFYGDKAYKGGNDYEIYEHKRTEGYKVKTFNDTIKLIKEKFF